MGTLHAALWTTPAPPTGAYHRIEAPLVELYDDDDTADTLHRFNAPIRTAPARAEAVNPRVQKAEPLVRVSRRQAAREGGWLDEASSEVDLGVRTWDELERDAAAYTLLTNHPVASASSPPPSVRHAAPPPPRETNPFKRRGGGAEMLNTAGSAEEAFWARASGRPAVPAAPRATTSTYPQLPRSQQQQNTRGEAATPRLQPGPDGGARWTWDDCCSSLSHGLADCAPSAAAGDDAGGAMGAAHCMAYAALLGAFPATACHYNGAADDPLEPYSGEAAALPPPPPDYYNALPDSPQQQRPRRWLVGWLLDGVGGAVVRLWGGDKSCCSPSSANSAPAAEEYPLYDRAPRMG